MDQCMDRRGFMVMGLAAAGGLGRVAAGQRAAPPAPRARVAITLDLEMSRNFPRWEDTHWDYEKGNLDDATKRYSLEAARRVAARGGRIHFFVVGRVFEQEDVRWLQAIADAGHPIGNHTYDHVYVLAKKNEELQYRFRRAPWLLRGRDPAEVIRENIAMTSEAMQHRLGVAAAGFRTPGGFSDGLAGRTDVQQMLLDLGFRWVSSKYPRHPIGKEQQAPTADVYEGIVAAQADAQPFQYPSGLVEVPMSPISDIGAFRGGRWRLEWFLDATRRALDWCVAQRAVFDFLAHPSCLLAVDPDFRAIDLICDRVQAADGQAEIVGLDRIAQEFVEANRSA